MRKSMPALLLILLLLTLSVVGIGSKTTKNQKPGDTNFPGNVKIVGDLNVDGNIYVKGVPAATGRTIAVATGQRSNCHQICQGKEKVVVEAVAPCDVTSDTGSKSLPPPPRPEEQPWGGICCVCKP